MVTRRCGTRFTTGPSTTAIVSTMPVSGKATNHPVQTMNWYDMVKWCNARSEKEGRTPAYYTDAAQTRCIGQAG